VAAGLTVALAAIVSAFLGDPPPGAPEVLPAEGWYRVRVAGADGLCVGSGDRRGAGAARVVAVQRACESAGPATFVRVLRSGHAVEWHEPGGAVTCLSVDNAYTGDGAALVPVPCADAAHQRFLFERASTSDRYRLRLAHSGLCAGHRDEPSQDAPGAMVVQTTCTGRADQEFVLDPADGPR
jgi:hypothetical protein